jgi:hypothetical protein
MGFLAQVIAELVSLVTFQQRRPPAPRRIGADEKDEGSYELLRSDYRGTGVPDDTERQS